MTGELVADLERLGISKARLGLIHLGGQLLGDGTASDLRVPLSEGG
jgi:hypothetical protein